MKQYNPINTGKLYSIISNNGWYFRMDRNRGKAITETVKLGYRSFNHEELVAVAINWYNAARPTHLNKTPLDFENIINALILATK